MVPPRTDHPERTQARRCSTPTSPRSVQLRQHAARTRSWKRLRRKAERNADARGAACVERYSPRGYARRSCCVCSILPPRRTAQVGLPFLSFIVIGWLGLQEGLKAKYKESERRKRYVEPEKPEDILAVRAFTCAGCLGSACRSRCVKTWCRWPLSGLLRVQKMRNEKTGNQDYKMVSVPGKQGSTLDGMSAARLRQELEALRESEVSDLLQSALHGGHTMPAVHGLQEWGPHHNSCQHVI